MSEATPPVCRRGWRTFECDDEECGFPRWEEATRDHLSPSLGECPACGNYASPMGHRADPDLPVDASGNLTIPWSERIRTLPHT